MTRTTTLYGVNYTWVDGPNASRCLVTPNTLTTVVPVPTTIGDTVYVVTVWSVDPEKVLIRAHRASWFVALDYADYVLGLLTESDILWRLNV